MTDLVTRARTMAAALDYVEQDVIRVRESMDLLRSRAGSLMSDVRKRLLTGAAEEHWFADDPDVSRRWGEQLATFVMGMSANGFDAAGCGKIAALPRSVEPRVPGAALVATVAVVNSWLTASLVDVCYDEPEKMKAALGSWQKLLAVTLDLMLAGTDE